MAAFDPKTDVVEWRGKTKLFRSKSGQLAGRNGFRTSFQNFSCDPFFEFPQCSDLMSANIAADVHVIVHAAIEVEAVFSTDGTVEFETHGKGS